MSISYAMLLDGGFVRHKLSTARTPIDAAGISRFATQVAALPCIAGMRLHRIYFYDAKPLEVTSTAPLGGGTIDFGASPVAARNKSLQAALVRQPYFALRIGELIHEGWKLRTQVLHKAGAKITIDSSDIQPSLRQKGVDMRIGLDIASLTLKKQVQVIVLVTADSDFIPAMKFARREGSQLFLVTMGHGIKDGMREHADLAIDEFPLQKSQPENAGL
jgi:uncharacterized LabA/DUF88 family protein